MAVNSTDALVVAIVLPFAKNTAGKPAGMKCYSYDGSQTTLETYWFDHNLQGDVIGVYNKNGTKLASYVYDAWGNFTVTYSNGGESLSAVVNNPFRYRGYYYDVDLGLYYLQSRYYDANTGRFISPDDITYLGANGDLNSYNLYAYCSNNPVMYADPSGNISLLLGLVVSFAIGTTASAISQYFQYDGDVNWIQAGIDGLFTAASTALAYTRVGKMVEIV